MVIHLTPQLEAALNEQARQRGVAPETLALDALRQRFLPNTPPIEPQDDWERRLFEAAIDCGRPRKIRVTDLHEQVEEERWVREAPPGEPPDMTPVPTAVVAIATGDGIRRIFRSLGVQLIVDQPVG